MALDYVRGGNPRFGSLLVGGLAVISLFLVCNWWSLTSKNLKLLEVVTDLEEQLKISGIEIDKCLVAKGLLEEKSKALQNGVAQSRVQLEQLRTEEDDVRDTLSKAQDALEESRKRISSLESSLKLKSTELESLKTLDEARNKTLEAMRTEKKSLNLKLIENEAKIQHLKNELSSLKKPVDPIAAMVLKGKTRANQEESIAFGGNHAEQEAQDENKAEEVKNDPPQEPVLDNAPAVDARELAMGGGAGNL